MYNDNTNRQGISGSNLDVATCHRDGIAPVTFVYVPNNASIFPVIYGKCAYIVVSGSGSVASYFRRQWCQHLSPADDRLFHAIFHVETAYYARQTVLDHLSVRIAGRIGPTIRIAKQLCPSGAIADIRRHQQIRRYHERTQCLCHAVRFPTHRRGRVSPHTVS